MSSLFEARNYFIVKWYGIRIPVSLGRCEHRLLDCTKISTYQITKTWCKQPGASNLMQATCHLVQANWRKQTVSTRTPSSLFSIALGPLMGRLFTGFIRSQGLSFSYFIFVENYPNSVKNIIFIRGQKLL